MLKFEHTEVVGWEAAIRGMRNPLNSWDKSDSDIGFGRVFCCDCGCKDMEPCRQNCVDIGKNDLDLMLRLRDAGTDHRKFMRMLVVYVDITAPLYWWKEFDTYKVGTVANSCSTMHKIADKEFTLEDFSCEHLDDLIVSGTEPLMSSMDILNATIKILNAHREAYIDLGNKLKTLHFNELEKRAEMVNLQKQHWWQMIQLLPSSYNQKRTVMLSYEVLANIRKSRKGHKQDEWRVDFMNWIESLPYSFLITGQDPGFTSLDMNEIGQKLQKGMIEGLKAGSYASNAPANCDIEKSKE